MKNLNFEIENIYFKNKIVAYKIKNFINTNTCNFLKDYYYNHNGLSSEKERNPNNLVYHSNSNTYFIADDSLSTSISKSLKEIINFLIKKNILLSYTFVRKYEKNVELIEHTDRESCEVSVSLNLHHDENQKEYFYISDSFKDEDITK